MCYGRPSLLSAVSKAAVTRFGPSRQGTNGQRVGKGTMRSRSIHTVLRLILSPLILALLAPAAATLTVAPNTWNVIGLDGNSPATGPSRRDVLIIEGVHK